MALSVKETQKRGDDYLRELCRVRSVEHVAILEVIAESGSSDTVRVAAIQTLWDRGYGKPAQAVTGEGGTGSSDLSDRHGGAASGAVTA